MGRRAPPNAGVAVFSLGVSRFGWVVFLRVPLRVLEASLDKIASTMCTLIGLLDYGFSWRRRW
eukprot:1335467-Alexandrium_andersonii.AAC.1